MKEILIYAVTFKILLLLITITLTLLLDKLYCEVSAKELNKGLISCLILGIVDIFCSICNLFYDGYILFYIYIFILLGLLSYSVTKDKLLISKYLFTYSTLLFMFFSWGRIITNEFESLELITSFETFILSITLSPICYEININLDSSFYVILMLLVTTFIHNISKLKFVREYLKIITKLNFKNIKCNDKE